MLNMKNKNMSKKLLPPRNF